MCFFFLILPDPLNILLYSKTSIYYYKRYINNTSIKVLSEKKMFNVCIQFILYFNTSSYFIFCSIYLSQRKILLLENFSIHVLLTCNLWFLPLSIFICLSVTENCYWRYFFCKIVFSSKWYWFSNDLLVYGFFENDL